jgi:prepilin-type N-terminal cleavage/methylation domain-containing protein
MMTTHRPRFVGQRGFTLVELLIACGIVGFVMGGVFVMLSAANVSYVTGSNQADAQAMVRAVLQRMTQEIREAGYNPTSVPVCTPAPGGNCIDPIINATATSFTIQNDRNGSGTIDPLVVVVDAFAWGNVNRGERITYSIAGTTLQRQETAVDGAAQNVLINVSQLNAGGLQPYFQYLDAAGNVLATPIANPSANQSAIRTVVINLQVGNQQGAAPANWRMGSIRVAMSDRIRLRNL